MIPGHWFQMVEESRQEQQQLRSYSHKALQNMLGYCRARVGQLSDHQQHLDFLAHHEHDLHALLVTWERLGRTVRNYQRFAEKCLLIELELARREGKAPCVHQEGKHHEA